MTQQQSNVVKFYRRIPGFKKHYAISNDGEVVSFVGKKPVIMKGSFDGNGYRRVMLAGDNGESVPMSCHRLVGMCYLQCPGDFSDFIINHINGVKDDNRVQNLEWCTYKHNAEHAGATGLTTKCIPVSVRNYGTGEVEHFPSAIECGRKLGLTKDAVLYRIRAGFDRVYPGNLQFCATSDLEKLLVSGARNRFGSSRPVLCKNALTGKVTRYEKLTHLSKELHVPLTTLYLWTVRADQPVVPGYIQLKFEDDPEPWREIDNPAFELSKFRGTRPIRVYNTRTGNESHYASCQEGAKACGISPTALNYRLSVPAGTVFKDGCTYEYVSF